MRNLVSTAATMALLLGAGVAVSAAPNASHAQIGIGISVNFAPPALPVYVQPPIPAVGYIWTPGFWSWDAGAQDYYWVPGTWVQPPTVGVLWTPGYWGWNNGVYAFNQGYWGPTIGFYGGINYGFGYTGIGYAGGYWQGGQLFYNTSVNNIGGVRITNVYNRTVINNVTNVSFNGPGGARARPTAAELAAARERHIPPTADQQRQVQVARTIPANHASINHGKPVVAATARPGVVKGPGVVPARSAPVFNRPANAAPAKVGPAAAARTPPARPAAVKPAARPEANADRAGASERGTMAPAPTRTPETRKAAGEGMRPAAERPAREAAPASAAARPARPETARPAPRPAAARPAPKPEDRAAKPKPEEKDRPQ
jgi:hypothetical protein